MADSADSNNADTGGSCETCCFYVSAKVEINSHTEANREASTRAARVEDKSIPARRNRALGDVATDLELQRWLCDAKGGPAGCKVALFCIASFVEQKQSDSLRYRP